MKTELIAPCGMNCGICSGYLALAYDVKQKDIRMPYCTGCRIRDKKCAFLKKQCDKLRNNKIKYCFECKDFPCKNLQGIDKRYRTYFRLSMIENLENIKKEGIEKFLEQQKKKWACPKCSGTVCCHNGICFNCELDKLVNKKKLYRWEDE
jgi:hypothetical protein